MNRKLLQINPVVRNNTSTGRIMQELGQLASQNGWDSYLAYSGGRDGRNPKIAIGSHNLMPIGNVVDTGLHFLSTRLGDRHGLASAAATRRFVQSLQDLRPDVVHIHNIHGYFVHYPTLFRYLRESGIPVVWTVHDCWLYTGHCYHYSFQGCDKWQTGCGNCPQQRKFPTSWIADRSDKNYEDKRRTFTSLALGQLTIVPVSQWIREEMSHSFLKGCNFRVIHNGIDTDIFRPYADDADTRLKYGLGNRKIYMAAASIWSQEKGLDDIIAISKMLRPDEVIAMVGTTPQLRRQLPQDGIVAIDRTSNVAELAQLYSAASAFLNPTWQDNYPTVNMEAISCGTPVITFRTGGSIETIKPGTGCIVEQGDRKGMLAAARDVDGSECRDYALANFRKQDRYLDYIRLYDEITR